MKFFGRRQREEKMERRIGEFSSGYWSAIRRRFRSNTMARWAMRVLYFLVFIALFSDFLANDKPLICKIENRVYSPVLKSYGVYLGLSSWRADEVREAWKEKAYQFVIFPLIPYSATSLDMNHLNFVGPFDGQQLAWRNRHWLGTDDLGRDVAAGLIAGTRISLTIGMLSMVIAAIIGLLLGSLAGFFGDHQLKIRWNYFIMGLLGIGSGFFWGFIARRGAFLVKGQFEEALGGGVLIWLGSVMLFLGLGKLLSLSGVGNRKLVIPADLLVMRLIEIFNSIPVLLLILAILSILPNSSIYYVMVIIGFIRWTGIARFIRAELLRIRKLEYIESARAMGFSGGRVLLRHAIPNALTPVLITFAFGVASAILIEATLSFLGIGIDQDTITWGSMLKTARTEVGAWWMAAFPGMAIFITVTVFNLLGEGLTEAIEPKQKNIG